MSKFTDYFQVGGTLDEDSPSYIERPADRELLEAIQKRDYCLILAPRQTGKSSLMVRTRKLLGQERAKAGIIDMQSLGNVQDPDRWFNDIIYQLQRSLNLKKDYTEWLNNHKDLGPTTRFQSFFEQVIHDEDGQVVVFVDEIDSILKLPFSDDFFTTLRALYNARATEPKLKNLVFVLLGVVTPAELIQDRSRTPYNIGTAISLEDLEYDEASVRSLKDVLGEESEPVIERIFYWTHGQPFLVQKLAQAISGLATEKRTADEVDKIVDRLFFRQKIEQDTHFKYIQDYIVVDVTRVRRCLRVYRQILRGNQIPFNHKETIHNRLKLSGLVRISQGSFALRNKVYKKIFTLDWTRQYAIERRHICPQCEFQNEEKAEFCTDCGQKLIRRCPECAKGQALHHKHCPNCGSDLESYFDALDALETARQLAEEHRWTDIVEQFSNLPDKIKLHTDKGNGLTKQIVEQLNEAKANEEKWKELHEKTVDSYNHGWWEKALQFASDCLVVNPRDAKVQALRDKLTAIIKQIERSEYDEIIKRAPDLVKENQEEALENLVTAFLKRYPNSVHSSQLWDYIQRDLPAFRKFAKFRKAYENLDFENVLSIASSIRQQLEGTKKPNQVILGTSLTPGAMLSEIDHALIVQEKLMGQLSPESGSSLTELNSGGIGFAAIETGSQSSGLKEINSDPILAQPTKDLPRKKSNYQGIVAVMVVIAVIASAVTFAILKPGFWQTSLIQSVESQAQTLWNQAKSFDGGQGVSARQQSIESLLKNAKKFRDEEQSVKSFEQTIQAIIAMENLKDFDQNRHRTSKVKADLDSLKDEAKKAGAETDAGKEWKSAMSLYTKGEQTFEAGDFFEAIRHLMSASSKFEQAKTRAKGVQMSMEKGQSVKTDKEKAESLLESIQAFDRGQGFGYRIDQLGFAMETATAFLESENFSKALEIYQKVVNEAQALNELNEKRRLATVMQELAFEAQNSSNITGALKHASVEWKIAKHSLVLANAKFKAGDLEQATAWWKKAYLQFKDAEFICLIEKAKLAKKAKNWLSVKRFANHAQEIKHDSPTANKLLKEAVAALMKFQEPMLNQPWIIPGLGMELMPIKGGEFQMGSNDGAEDERPVHTVILTKPFWMGKFEVTQEEYKRIMAGENPSNFKDDPLNPVETIRWNEPMEFCKKLTEMEKKNDRVPQGYEYRLPTEAEWEYACRAGTTTPFGIGDGNNLSFHQANFKGDYPYGNGEKGPSLGKTSPVGSYKNEKNAWGLYDMHGNVWEWCMDWKGSYAGRTQTDPWGSKTGKSRVLRGGSWSYEASNCRSADRGAGLPTFRSGLVGFRVVLAPVQP